MSETLCRCRHGSSTHAPTVPDALCAPCSIPGCWCLDYDGPGVPTGVRSVKHPALALVRELVEELIARGEPVVPELAGALARVDAGDEHAAAMLEAGIRGTLRSAVRMIPPASRAFRCPRCTQGLTVVNLDAGAGECRRCGTVELDDLDARRAWFQSLEEG